MTNFKITYARSDGHKFGQITIKAKTLDSANQKFEKMAQSRGWILYEIVPV